MRTCWDCGEPIVGPNCAGWYGWYFHPPCFLAFIRLCYPREE